MFIDVEKYRHHVQSIDLPQDRKDELIHTIYAILQSFVDRAFGMHPVQLSLGSAPQKLPELGARCAIVDANSINRNAEESAPALAEEGEIP